MRYSARALLIRACILSLFWAPASHALDPQAKGVFVRVTDTGHGFCGVIKLPGVRKPPTKCCGETFGPDRWVIFDAGNWDAQGKLAYQKIAELIPRGSDIELLVLSHGDADHLGAVVRICRAYRVRRVLRTGQMRDSKTWRRSDAAIKQEIASDGCVEYSLAKANLPPGSVFDFGTSMFTVLSGYHKPPADWKLDHEAEAFNAVRIVLRFTFQGKTILFTGDATHQAEAAMIARRDQFPLKADVLMAPHHSVDRSSSTAFIEAVKPQFVIFSAGHRYSHPRAVVAKRYLAAGIKPQFMLRTDRGDTEGELEWNHGSSGFADPPGDDDIDIHIGFDGKIAVEYRNLEDP